MGKPGVKEILLVEGRYDRNALAQVVDATILETSGFGIFSDGEKLKLLRRLARERGLVVLTDSDGAGLVIRNYLRSALPKEQVKHAYIPEVAGKERRKRRAGKAGTLGVEGMPPAVLLEALRRAGATFLGEDAPLPAEVPLTKADLYALGLSGGAGSAARRAMLLRRLDLPENLGANALLDVLNIFCPRGRLLSVLREMDASAEN
ncbi:MAG TPA: DUF4093 domain-containing protein [Oscillospiraceae bacterium]|nr:DUF4093 domain-containing protein [Oscillospiraceae bacterium]